MEAKHMLQAMTIKRNGAMSCIREILMLQHDHVNNGLVREKVEAVAEKVAEAVGNWMTAGSRIEMYATWETWFQSVAEQVEMKATKEKRAQHI